MNNQSIMAQKTKCCLLHGFWATLQYRPLPAEGALGLVVTEQTKKSLSRIDISKVSSCGRKR